MFHFLHYTCYKSLFCHFIDLPIWPTRNGPLTLHVYVIHVIRQVQSKVPFNFHQVPFLLSFSLQMNVNIVFCIYFVWSGILRDVVESDRTIGSFAATTWIERSLRVSTIYISHWFATPYVFSPVDKGIKFWFISKVQFIKLLEILKNFCGST